MAIRQMINTREPGTLRDMQQRMIVFGRIRTGVFETPPGKRGRPAKLDRFRFTSLDQGMIGALADQYGGTVEEFVPQGNGKRGWQVTSDASTIPVYIVNRQKIDPTYECWAGGGRCVRRCDGVYDSARDAPCVCNGLHPDEQPPAPRDMCKMTTRVNVMLPEIEGVGSWLYESHGENFAIENGGVLAQFVASADRPVPAHFRLEPEVRQHRKADGTFEKREFYVARFWVTALTPGQIALGGDVVSKILDRAGSPAALATPVSAPAIGAAPEAVPAGPRPPEMAAAVPPAHGMPLDLQSKILRDIENQTTVEGLEAIKAKLKARGIVPSQAVKDAWKSKSMGVAAAQLTQMAREDPDGFADAVDALPPGDRTKLRSRLDVVTDGVEPPFTDPLDEPGWRPTEFDGPPEHVGGVEFTKIGDDPFNHPFADVREQYDEALARGASPQDILDAGGPLHWLATDDQALHRAAQAVDPDGVEDGPGAGLPMVPIPDEGFDAGEELLRLVSAAGKRTPPWTTAQVNAAVTAAFELGHIGQATGEQLARVRAALLAGLL